MFSSYSLTDHPLDVGLGWAAGMVERQDEEQEENQDRVKVEELEGDQEDCEISSPRASLLLLLSHQVPP